MTHKPKNIKLAGLTKIHRYVLPGIKVVWYIFSQQFDTMTKEYKNMRNFMERVKNSFYYSSGIGILALLIAAYFFNSMFVVESKVVYYTLQIIFVVTFLVLLCEIYKGQESRFNTVLLIVMPLLLTPYVTIPLLLLPLAGVIIIYLLNIKAKKRKNLFIKALIFYCVFFCLVSIAAVFASFFSGLVCITTLEEVVSPDKSKVIVVTESDEGALGGSVSVYTQKRIEKHSFFGISERFSDKKVGKRRLYFGRYGERPKVEWVDNENIKINNKKFNILTSSEWVIK
jgi:hypothetical protein